MRYEFQISITEADFADFQVFHMTRSAYGRQLARRLKGLMAGISALAVVFSFLMDGMTETVVLYAVLLALLNGIFLLRYNRFIGRSVGKTLKQMKKTGKMPYSPEVRIELDEEKAVEITPTQRTELAWATVERLCVVEGVVWYLYLNNSAAMILPVDQLKSQTDIEQLYRFLEGKCSTVEHYEK